MKHIRTRRRFRFILVCSLAVSSLLFVEDRIEAFSPQLKSVIELRLGELTNKQVQVSIGSIDGGIIRTLTLHDVTLRDKDGGAIFPLFRITRIASNYRLWDTFVGQSRNAGRADLPGPNPYIVIHFATKNREMAGYIRLESGRDALTASGSIQLFGKERVDVTGKASGDLFTVECKPRSGRLKIEAYFPSDSAATFRFGLERLKLYDLDVSGAMVLTNRMVKDTAGPSSRTGHFEGEIEARDLTVNDKPFFDIRGSYMISEGLVSLPSLKLGNEFSVSGSVGLRMPHLLDAVITANNVGVSRILSYFDAQDAIKMTGVLNGKFELKGPLKKVRLDARMDIRDGTIMTLDFDRLSATLKGDGPLIRIEDSRITRQSGYFSLGGEIDLGKAGKGNVFENVKMTTDDTAIVWDEWDLTKAQGAQELRMNKKVSEEFNLGFKKVTAGDQSVDESLRPGDSVQVEYKLQPNDSLKVEVGQDTNFFGLQHKDRF
jgi:hypothetical protein